MDEQRLREIEERAAKATAGPWDREFSAQFLAGDVYALHGADQLFVGQDMKEADATFCAHAREDVPALVAEVRRLREALRSIRDGEAGTLTGAQHLAVLALTHRD